MRIVIVGLSITSSWGNGHATTYRGLVREMTRRGHDILFLEHDVPWYAENRDLPEPPFGRTELYGSLEELRDRFTGEIARADAVILGSYVRDGIPVGRWIAETAGGVFAYYDIDTPVTIRKLKSFDYEYVDPSVVSNVDLYLSFAGGPALEWIQRRYDVPEARPLYCSVDPEAYHPEPQDHRWDLGYLGTYSQDRQPPLVRLMLVPARRWTDGRFAVAGPQYPETIAWPGNVDRIEHLPPSEHRAFYNQQRFTLSVTRREMVRWGYAPSVRLFEAAACGTPVISDRWPGIDQFFAPGSELLIAHGPGETLEFLRRIPEDERRAMGERARERALRDHTAASRAEELEEALDAACDRLAAATSIGATGAAGTRGGPRADGAADDPAEAPAVSRRAAANRASPSGPSRSSGPSGDGRSDPDLAEEISALAPWFHNLHLPDGTQTAPDHRLGDFPREKWLEPAEVLPADLDGWTVLDIGCNAGFHAFELAKRGAWVTAIDHNPHYLKQARWAAQRLDPDGRVRFERRDVYQLAELPVRYDLVLFMGVFYHLRYPLLGLDLAARKARRLFMFQSMMMPGEEVAEPLDEMDYSDSDRFEEPGWPKMAFIEHRFAEDPTNWWAPNRACIEAMLRSAGFEITSRVRRDTYLCGPASADGREPWFADTRDRATGAVRPRESAAG